MDNLPSLTVSCCKKPAGPGFKLRVLFHSLNATSATFAGFAMSRVAMQPGLSIEAKLFAYVILIQSLFLWGVLMYVFRDRD